MSSLHHQPAVPGNPRERQLKIPAWKLVEAFIYLSLSKVPFNHNHLSCCYVGCDPTMCIADWLKSMVWWWESGHTYNVSVDKLLLVSFTDSCIVWMGTISLKRVALREMLLALIMWQDTANGSCGLSWPFNSYRQANQSFITFVSCLILSSPQHDQILLNVSKLLRLLFQLICSQIPSVMCGVVSRAYHTNPFTYCNRNERTHLINTFLSQQWRKLC